MGKTVQAWHVENQGERSKGSELFIYLFKTKHSLFGALSNIHSLVLCSHHELKKKKTSSPVLSSSNTVLRARPTAQQATRNRMSLFPVTCRDLCSLQGQTSRFYLGSWYLLVYKHLHRHTYNLQVLYIFIFEFIL